MSNTWLISGANRGIGIRYYIIRFFGILRLFSPPPVESVGARDGGTEPGWRLSTGRGQRNGEGCQYSG